MCCCSSFDPVGSPCRSLLLRQNKTHLEILVDLLGGLVYSYVLVRPYCMYSYYQICNSLMGKLFCWKLPHITRTLIWGQEHRNASERTLMDAGFYTVRC